MAAEIFSHGRISSHCGAPGWLHLPKDFPPGVGWCGGPHGSPEAREDHVAHRCVFGSPSHPDVRA